MKIVSVFREFFKPMPLWLRFLIGAYFLANLGRFLSRQDNFNILYAGAARLVNGAAVHVSEINAFTYPTFFAFALSPLTLFGYTTGITLFFITSFAILIAGLFYLARELVPGDLVRRRLAIFLSLAGSFRFYQGVFDDQQSDLLVFGALLLGASYLSKRESWQTPVLWALAGAVKANPIFMVAPLLLARRFRQVVVFVAATLFFWLLPDVISPAIPQATKVSTISAPSVVIHTKNSTRKVVEYAVQPQEHKDWPRYLREWIGFTMGGGSNVGAKTIDNGSWWNQQGNAQNQAITHWTFIYLRHRPLTAGVDYKWVFLVWTAILSGLLALLIKRRGLDLVAFLLSYQVFVLLGPVSSKPHFLPVIGLLMYAWSKAFADNKKIDLWIICVITCLLAVTTPDLIGFDAYNFLGAIGFYGWLVFGLWVYVYQLAWSSKPLEQQHPRP